MKQFINRNKILYFTNIIPLNQIVLKVCYVQSNGALESRKELTFLLKKKYIYIRSYYRTFSHQ